MGYEWSAALEGDASSPVVGTDGSRSNQMQRPAAPSGPYQTADLEPDTVLSRISSLLKTSTQPVDLEFFVDYFGVFQGNPVGGQSQGVAYS